MSSIGTPSAASARTSFRSPIATTTPSRMSKASATTGSFIVTIRPTITRVAALTGFGVLFLLAVWVAVVVVVGRAAALAFDTDVALGRATDGAEVFVAVGTTAEVQPS